MWKRPSRVRDWNSQEILGKGTALAVPLDVKE